MLKDKKVQDILAIMFTLGYFIMLIIFEITAYKESDSMIMGLSTAEALILSFYFGASKKQD